MLDEMTPRKALDPAAAAAVLNVAMVGGGELCMALLRLLEDTRARRPRARVVGVADSDPETPGMVEAEGRGIFTTTHPSELFELPELDLVIESTGSPEVLAALDCGKPARVQIMDCTAARLFQEIVSVGEELDAKEDEAIMASSLAHALSAAASEGVMVLDRDYRIVSVNGGACSMAGLTPEEARGRFCFQVSHQAVSPCHSPDTPCPMRETLATGRAAHAIHEHLHLDGEAHYCDVATYPLANSKGEVVQVLEVFRDITSELADRMERRTQVIKNDLAQLVQEDKLIALGKLVASVAHEINNPIGSILNFNKLMLTFLREQNPPPEEVLSQFEGWLDLSVREAKRCGEIVSNLLSFARQQSVEPKRLDLVALLRQIIALTQHRMALANVTPTVTLPEDPLEVWGDATQIQQCFTNMIFNALEAMPEGGELTIRGAREEGEVFVEIGDTGPGIPDHVLPHIFEPFFTTKREGHGVGLGLSMVHGIVKEHRGRIDVDGGVGRGARLKVVLPDVSCPTDGEVKA